MDLNRFFADFGLTPSDQIAFARAFQVSLAYWGREQCWRLDQINHPIFFGFTTSNKTALLYKGFSARILFLGMAGQFGTELEIAVRRSCCESPHCLNPDHYFWGSKSQAMLEQQKNRNPSMSKDVIRALRIEYQEGRRILDLSRRYKVPYHTARRICSGETYDSINETEKPKMDNKAWEKLEALCRKIITRYPEESRNFNVEVHVSNELECPWHRNGETTHKGNFGLMGECLDCMDEIKTGRCTVDVTKFDFRWYWTIKRFWDYVEIKGEDECWKWNGPTKKNDTESVAYFPSPFHSGKSQSASRVAFWVSRGYTGKYRVFSKTECIDFCCNPKHLTIRELKGSPQPDKIEVINLSYGNIFDQYRKSHAQSQPDPAD